MRGQPSIPWFADGDDSDRERRMDDFARYARDFFSACPLSLMRGLSNDELADLQQSIIMHCVDNDLRILKQFRRTGANFDAWFCTVCLNKTRDYLKSRGRYRQVIASDPSGDNVILEDHPDPKTSPEQRAHVSQVAEQVDACIRQLDQYCRLLIRMEGDEFKPREMVRVLRWPAAKAKKVSDDLAYCLVKLRKLLAQRGITEA